MAFGLALVFPFALRLAFPDVYHRFDVGTLASWADFTHPFRDVYLTDCFCNYPIVGLVASTGVIRGLGDIPSYLFVLAAVETLNVAVVYAILRRLRVTGAGAWALTFAVLPSTWAGGALWGQIDHIGLLFLLVIVWCLVRLPDAGPRARLALGAAIGLLGYLGLFLKQLMVFPLAAMAVAFLAFALALPRGRWAVLASGVVGVVVPFVAVDAWVRRPAQFVFTHYERVLATGSDHMDVLSGNGTNIWVLAGTMDAPSTVPLIGTMTAQQLGLAGFAVLAVVLTAMYVRGFVRMGDTRARIGLSAAYVALFNAGFCLLLTGIHERYLFYCYPFLLIAVALSRRAGVRGVVDRVVLVVGSVVYGMFVLAILMEWLKVNGEHVVTYAHVVQPIVLAVVLAWNLPLLGTRAWGGERKSVRNPRPVRLHLPSR